MTIETGTDELSPDAARVYRAARAINAMSDSMDAELLPEQHPLLDALRLLGSRELSAGSAWVAADLLREPDGQSRRPLSEPHPQRCARALMR